MSKAINNMIENNETKTSTATHNKLHNKSLTSKACLNQFVYYFEFLVVPCNLFID